jgi:hypothetical protein
MNKNIEFILRPYTHKELSALYGVNRKTFLKWLKPFQKAIGPRNGHFYSTIQVEVILRKLGRPGIVLS